MTVIRPRPGTADWWEQQDAVHDAEDQRREHDQFLEAEAVDAYYAALDTPPAPERHVEFNVDDRNQDHEEEHEIREGRR